MSDRGRVQKQLPSSPFRVFLYIVLIGPPLAGLTIFTIIAIPSLFMGGIDAVGLSFELLKGLVIASYMFGSVQAIVVGAILAQLSRPDGKFTYLQAFFTSGVVGVVVGAIIVVNFVSIYLFAILLAVSGVYAACVIRAVFTKRFGPVDE